MPIALIHPDNLRCLDENCEVEEVELEVVAARDDYCVEDGDGIWISAFLEFLEKIVRERCQLPNFSFSNDGHLNARILEEVEDPYLRALFIRFANAHFEAWRERDVSIPDFDDVRGDSREYCDDCESGWEETHAEYDGPLPEDVEEDEDVSEAGVTEAERQARRLRNQERARERQRRERDREEAESEVIDREFTCEEDCDGFFDHVRDRVIDGVDTRLDLLEKRWKKFLEECGEDVLPDMPAMHLSFAIA